MLPFRLLTMLTRVTSLVWLMFSFNAARACADDQALESSASAGTDYSQNVKPLLAEKCAACHGGLKQESDLRLDHGSFIQSGGASGKILNLEAPELSELIQRVSTDDLSIRMPPEGEGAALTDEEIRILRDWIASGAHSPQDETMPIDPNDHWAWQVPRQSPPPSHNASGARNSIENPIDAFIAEQLHASDIEPNPVASPRTRVRRLYFDIVGLPPPVNVLREFEANPSEEAWTLLVDKLLDSPAHGERWARHWMDVWRYSDWSGYKNQIRGSQRHIWRWRDWIVESLNDDKGYDQMLREMLAGDELADEDPDVLRATGFLARNYHNSNRNIWLDATVEHTAKAFLGLTINCARCHDHKYDPISQREYYAFRAIFEPHNVRTERVPGQSDTLKDGLVRAYDANLNESTYLFHGGNEKQPDKDHPVPPNTPEIVDVPYATRSVTHSLFGAVPNLKKFVEKEDLHEAEQKVLRISEANEQLTELPSDATDIDRLKREQAVLSLEHAKAELNSLRSRWKADRYRYESGHSEKNDDSDTVFLGLKLAAVKLESQAKLVDAEIQWLTKRIALGDLQLVKEPDSDAIKKAKLESTKARKAYEQAKKNVAKAASVEVSSPELQEMKYTSVVTAYPSKSTGRRSALAQWLTDAKNPLTARVAVNYLWLHHFGEPLVENVFDFGLRSPQPAHRKLLDWLAVELQQNDWSLKHLHRLMVNSDTYQRSSRSRLNFEANKIDPDNKLFWRANVRRLSAEVVRDSLLAVANGLDPTLGGPEIDFTQGEKVPRKSLYFRTAYEKQMTMLVIFDAAAPNECYRRSESIIPQQALALSNSPLSLDLARLLTRQLWTSAYEMLDEEKDQRRIEEAFETLLGRKCTDEELRTCQQFLKSQAQLLSRAGELTPTQSRSKTMSKPARNAKARARTNLVHTLMNHNDFVTIR